MITDRFKTSKEIWNLTCGEAIKAMQEELENARDEYERLGGRRNIGCIIHYII